MSINHKNFSETTLAAAITTTGETSITVTSETSFPAVQFIISIDTEAMLVTNVSTVTWTVTRGYEGSMAATHTNGTAIYHDISAAEADAIAAKLPLAGGTMSGPIVMTNQNITLIKLLTMNGEIDDGNSGTADTIDWNTGTAHKSTLTDNVTLAFTGYGGDICSGGTASASDYYSAFYPSLAFDDDAGTHWKTNTPGVQWLQYLFGIGRVIIAYSVRPIYSSPMDWTLQGSNDGINFTVLSTVTGAESGVRVEYAVSSPSSYTYYRLIVTSPDYPQICEVELFESGVAAPAAPCFLTLKLVQDGTGGRTVTWPASVKGSPVINPAIASVSNVLFYWDGTSYWTLNGLPWVEIPASASAPGMIGQMAYASGFIYVCVSSGAWQRVAIADW